MTKKKLKFDVYRKVMQIGGIEMLAAKNLTCFDMLFSRSTLL